MIKQYVEKRSREAAQVIVTPVDTVQYCSPRPLNPEILSDVHVKMEEKDEGWMNPERDEFESPSAGTDFETPRQQCHPIWEIGRTTADGFLTASVGSNLRKHTSPATDTWTREPSELRRISLSCSRATNPKTRRKAAKKKTVRPWWGRRRAATAMERGCNGSLFFS